MRLSWLHYPIIGTFVFALAMWFATTLRPVQSSLQYEFDSWLEGQRRSIQQLSAYFIANQELQSSQSEGQDSPTPSPPLIQKLAPPDVAQLPHLHAALKLEGGQMVRFSLLPEANPSRPSQILRLLDLMKEAGIFDRSLKFDSADVGDRPSVTIRVQGPDRSFEAAVPQHVVEGNVPALLMLRLFKEYGVEVRESAQPIESAFLSEPSPSEEASEASVEQTSR